MPPSAAGRMDDGRIALAVRAGQRVIVIEYHPFADTAEVIGYAPEGLAPVWRFGLPPLIWAHSAYRQELRAEIRGGVLRIYQRGPYCRAAHHVDVQSGRLLVSRFFGGSTIGCALCDGPNEECTIGLRPDADAQPP